MTDRSGPRATTRAWPVGIRSARPADRDAVLSFASTTFDGWDYIAEVWDTWLTDEAGAFVVATAEAGPDGAPPTARDGEPMVPGRVVGITHLAMLSRTEGWIEGIRVDPEVRGMEVATELQRAVLQLAAECGATVVRWLTGARNEASLRLAARIGLHPVGRWRFHGREREDERVGPSGRPTVEAALGRAVVDGLLLPPDADAKAWFARITADPTFQAGRGLYERTSWAYQSLTAALLADHIAAGEVLAEGPDADGRWAALVIDRTGSLDEGELWPALLVGAGSSVVRLLDRLGGASGPLARVRLPDGAPLLDGHATAFRGLGYAPHEGTTVVVEGAVGAPVVPPMVPPAGR